MSLSLPQQLWLKRAYVSDVVDKLHAGVFTLDDLREYALANQAFAEKFALVEAALGNVEDPAEPARFDAVCVAFKAFEDKPGSDSSALKALFDAYLKDYSKASYAAEHVEAVKAMNIKVEGLFAEAAEAEWQKLTAAPVQPDALKEFLEKYKAVGSYLALSDDLLWNQALTADDVVAAVESYEGFFAGKGKHSAQAAEVYNATNEWFRVDVGNIYNLFDFLESYPGHLYERKALARLAALKDDELASLRRAPALYDNETFCALYRRQVCTRRELIEAAGIDDTVFERILEDSAIRAALPSPPGRNSRYACAAGEQGLLDVIFFGIAASGKTCVLSGLLANDSVVADEANYSGEYASLLKRYAHAGVALSGTPDYFSAVIRTSFMEPGGTKRSFNLVEMAGEAFSNKIVTAVGRSGKVESQFEAMENATASILTGRNNKLIFLLIDPTGDEAARQRQIEAFNRLRSLMFDVEGNRAVMERVKGLHFIVTKADTLGDNRPDKARDIVCRILNTAAREDLVAKCREYGINHSHDSEWNGRPEVFAFSLGSFTVGNIYTYNPADSDRLLSFISNYAVNTPVREGFWARLRRFILKLFSN